MVLSDPSILGDSLPPEPAAFSVKTTPRTRNPKVTKAPSPAMSSTPQVSSAPLTALTPPLLLLFFSHSLPSRILTSSFTSPLSLLCVRPLLVTASHLFCLSLSHVFDFFFSFHTTPSHSITCNGRAGVDWPRGARHGVMENDGHGFHEEKNPSRICLFFSFSVWYNTTSYQQLTR